MAHKMAHKRAHKMVLESCKRSPEGLLVLGIPSVIEGAYIHIFGFTNRENNQFQNKSMRQNLNI